ncbi:asparagine synthase-related protein [Shimazuella kribbensis]|uniref:asparagine synthase-related protein n=1 Tax=Shimazuella kribbensis TaxID=139808 RepID=UPI0004104853|nr:asparagine synthase C-terminal domain-containing protein [Shimazuella kribbensis]
MFFKEQILRCSNDSLAHLQVNGWIVSGKSAEAVRFLYLLKEDCEMAMREFAEILLYSPKKLLCSIEGNFLLSYWNAEKQRGILFKSLLCKHSLYYAIHPKEISWSTNPLHICSQNYLEQIEQKYLLVACLEDSIPRNESYYKDVFRLPAGSLSTIYHDAIQVEVIDTITPIPLQMKRSIEDFAIESRRLIESHARKCLFGLSKVGVILSGGLDSSITITSLRKLGFDVVGIHWSFAGILEADESDYAEQITAHLKVPLIKIDATKMIKQGDYLQMEWEFTAPYPHPFYRLFEQTLDICSDLGISVCSSGYFGDIIFGPSDPWKVNFTSIFRAVPFFDGIKWLSEYWQTPKFKARKVSHDRLFHYKAYLSEESKRRIDTGEIRAYQREKLSFIDQLVQSFDNETDSVLETHVYEKKGIAPFHLFASKELIELALTIPLPYKMFPSGAQEYIKPIMRRIYPDMPPAILTRNHRQIMNAFNERYVLENKVQILSILGVDSYLATCHVIDPQKLVEIS